MKLRGVQVLAMAVSSIAVKVDKNQQEVIIGFMLMMMTMNNKKGMAGISVIP